MDCHTVRSLLLWLFAAVGGAGLTLLALLLFYLSDGLQWVASPVTLTGTKLELAIGQGTQTPDGLEVHQTSPQGVAFIRGAFRSVPANLYRRFSWRVSGLSPDQKVWLAWATTDNPRFTQKHPLPSGAAESGVLDLSTEPAWQGRIIAIGLAVYGPLPQPLSVHELELQPLPLTTQQLLQQMLIDWGMFEDWSQRSINYTAGAPLNSLFPPVVMIALWIGFSAVLYAMCRPPRRMPGALTPYAILFLIGWLLLDMRWQKDLGQRLVRTAESFAGKDQTDRQLAALDGQFYQFLLEVRRLLPEKPARLFIISADPGGFLAGRARWHLLPHNGYPGLNRVPHPNEVRPGDYVLVLAPLNSVRYDDERHVLEDAGGALLVETLYAAAPGVLFRIKGD